MVPTKLRILYGDTDRMGVVYYANYLRFFEAGRNELIRAKGARYRDIEARTGLGLPVVEAHCRYAKPARYDDVVRVETRVEEIRRASVRFAYQVFRDDDGTLLAEGHTVHAVIDRDMKPVRLPEELRALLEAPDP